MDYIISAAQGGLSNRVKCLLSCMKISEETGRKLILYWPKDSACNSRFRDLFENEISEISKGELRFLIKKERVSINKILDKKFALMDDTTLKSFSEKNISLMFEKIPPRVQKEITSYLKKLKIKKEIIFSSQTFLKKIKGKFVGVHIRKGDFLRSKNGLEEISPDKLFVEEMKVEVSKNPKIKFVISTEDKKTEEEFKKIFGERIFSYPKTTERREDSRAVREAFIEMLILSKASKIIGTYGSTFSEVAWFLGNCKSKVKIILDKIKFNLYKNSLKADKKIIGNKIKKFLYEKFYPPDERILDRK
ncbi:hypothetical protein J4411_00210 [Candidatus Pacearchaeota archaeon]|nr:hypothetical protein [Candidatus Pacearchaeota archaeon]